MDSLLTSLRKYHPRENTNPVENFITEAFAWLLRKDDELSHSLINHIAQKLSDTDKVLFAEWRCQLVYASKLQRCIPGHGSQVAGHDNGV